MNNICYCEKNTVVDLSSNGFSKNNSIDRSEICCL